MGIFKVTERVQERSDPSDALTLAISSRLERYFQGAAVNDIAVGGAMGLAVCHLPSARRAMT